MKTKQFFFSIFFLFLLSFIVKAQNPLWSLTTTGGAYSSGAIIKANSNGTGLAVAFSFQSPEGYIPYGDLLQASDGNLYGTCLNGGSFASCTVFKYSPATNTYLDVYDFDIIHGDFPRSGVIEGPNGMLYGAASSGGQFGGGVIYGYDINFNMYADLFDMTSLTGTNPNGSPILANNGKLYGTAASGGQNGNGVIYIFDISSNTYTDLFDFTNNDGVNPIAGLIQGANGILYGTCREGGLNNSGVIFSFDPAINLFTKLFDLDLPLGSNPKGTLMESSNGLLYGMTNQGGASNSGVIFSFDRTTNTYTNLYDFNGTDGAGATGRLMETGNILFGTTTLGGAFGLGVMFNFDLISNTYAKVLDFDGTNGANPTGGFVPYVATGIAQYKNDTYSVFPNPFTNKINVAIQSNQQGKTTFNLKDLSGHIIYSSVENMIPNNSKTINLNNISSGIYFLEIINAEGRVYKKIVKD